MTTNYMLADMLTRIRNGQRAKIKSIKQPKSILCLRVLEVLVDEGVVQNFGQSRKIHTLSRFY